MNRFAAAVSWSGTDVTMSMFVIGSADAPVIHVPPLEPPPSSTKAYDLVDEAGVLGGRRLYEIDFTWKALPADPASVVTRCLESAVAQGAVVAWFAFEASFSFDHLLDADTANQVYALATGTTVELALVDDVRLSPAWTKTVVETGLGTR